MKANDIQHGGGHYKGLNIQPWELDYFEGNALKYIVRWEYKGGIENLRKAQHYIEKIIELHK